MNGLVDRLFHKTRERTRPKNVNQLHAEKLTFQDRLALLITKALGTMWAVYFLGVFMAGWIIWQQWLAHQPFDSYPFAFLLFLGNIVQLLLMPLIMVGQNIQGRHAELRAEEAYKATVGGYQDAEHIMDHLVALGRELPLHRELLCSVVTATGTELPSRTTTIIEGIHVSIEGTMHPKDRQDQGT